MRHGDLEDLVLTMISIDQYESKLDNSAIVVGFYVNDKDAADDLNRFIQKSAVELLDSEVSPAPDQHGYYLVFVELLNDVKIVDNIETILQEVSPLVADDSWQMQLRGVDKVLPFSRKTLTRRFSQLRSELEIDVDPEIDKKVVEFLSHSDVIAALIEDDHVELKSSFGQFTGILAGFGDVEAVLVENKLENTAISLEFSDVVECKRLSHMLGENWVSTRIGNHTLLQRNDTDVAILLRNPRFF
jgi:hypothetical protein